MRQWIPISKFLAISAIIDDSGEFNTSSSGVMHALAKYWAPVFDGTSSQHDASIASRVLSEAPKSASWNWSLLQYPDSRTFSYIARNSSDNSTGFDGLPYSAHDTQSGLSSVLMEQMFGTMRNYDSSAPPDMFKFNHLLQACIPKKSNFVTRTRGSMPG